MKRTLRNGLVIAGMAGGFLLLGQAVASADETTDATASGTVTTENTGGDGGSGGDATSATSQEVEAENEVSNSASTGNIDTGAVSWVVVVAGNGNETNAGSGSGDVTATQDVTTEVNVSSEANGGNVSGSNNASAGDGASYNAEATGSVDSTNTGGDGNSWYGEGGDATSATSQEVEAENEVSNNASSGNIYTGAESGVFVLAGNHNELNASSHGVERCYPYPNGPVTLSLNGYDKCKKWGHDDGDVDATQNITTHVDIDSQANGGDVAYSNNATAGTGADYNAVANGTVNSTNTGGNGGKKHGEGGDATDAVSQEVESENEVSNNASTGNIDTTAESIVKVIAGNGNKLYCWSDEGDVTCSQNVTTIINIISSANGGDVTCSNNASAGSDQWVCKVNDKPRDNGNNNGDKDKDCPKEQPEPAPAVVPVVTPTQQQPVSYTAQPAGELAYTGADVSLPLTLGLLALVAGIALSVIGRRRETETV